MSEITWQNVDTLERVDDIPVLLRVLGRPVLASWDTEQGVWVQWLSGDYYGLGISNDPTGWLPVPK